MEETSDDDSMVVVNLGDAEEIVDDDIDRLLGEDEAVELDQCAACGGNR